MSYTKRFLNTISILLTILIFICLHLLNYQISLLFQNNSLYYSNKVYSKQIPIEKQSKAVKTININDNLEYTLINHDKTEIEKVSKLQKEMENAEKQKVKGKTQRQVVQENKENRWRIQIPKISLDAHIEEGTTSNILLRAVGHFKETTKWNGNVCLAAHNRGYQCNFFEKIKNLKIGDEIIYSTKQGKRVYKVQINKVISETDWRYIQETKTNKITLITCEENRSEYRRCVQAVQIAEIE